jgi:hypothetical protein
MSGSIKVVRQFECRHCGGWRTATLLMHPNNRGVFWKCESCGRPIPIAGKLYQSHAELRETGIDPALLPEVES